MEIVNSKLTEKKPGKQIIKPDQTPQSPSQDILYAVFVDRTYALYENRECTDRQTDR